MNITFHSPGYRDVSFAVYPKTWSSHFSYFTVLENMEGLYIVIVKNALFFLNDEE